MGLVNSVKQVLRHCGHALVSTIHDRLNGIEGRLDRIEAQTAGVATIAAINESQTALLQSSIYLVETVRQLQAAIGEGQSALGRSSTELIQVLQRIQGGMNDNQTYVRRSTADLFEILQQIQTGMDESQAALRQSTDRLADALHQLQALSQKPVI